MNKGVRKGLALDVLRRVSWDGQEGGAGAGGSGVRSPLPLWDCRGDGTGESQPPQPDLLAALVGLSFSDSCDISAGLCPVGLSAGPGGTGRSHPALVRSRQCESSESC